MNLCRRYPVGSALLGATLLLVAAQGCGDSGDDNVKPPDVNGGSKNTGGSKASGGNKASGGTTGNTAGGDEGGAPGANGGADDGGPKGGTSPTGGKGGNSSTGDGGSGNEGGGGGDTPPIPACDKPETGADGCFNCPKDKDVEQWLNRCTDGDCVPFDNKARLPKLKADGSVPPLPV